MANTDKITSRDNQRLIAARKARDGRESTLMFIEGRRLVGEALRSGLVFDDCFIVDGFGDIELLDVVRTRLSRMAELPERIFATIADTRQPQGIIVLARRPESAGFGAEWIINSAALPSVIFLNEINNPSNLGAILRTAEAAGVAGVIVSTNSADIYSPRSLRAAMGAGFRLPVWDNAAASEVITWAKEKGLTVTAAEASGAVNYIEVDWKTPRLLIFGSEAHGLRGFDRSTIDEVVGIPMRSEVESLNLAVSAGIILFEALRQLSRGSRH